MVSFIGDHFTTFILVTIILRSVVVVRKPEDICRMPCLTKVILYQWQQTLAGGVFEWFGPRKYPDPVSNSLIFLLIALSLGKRYLIKKDLTIINHINCDTTYVYKFNYL